MKARTIKKHDKIKQKRKERLLVNDIPKLRRDNAELNKAAYQLRQMVDALLIRTAIKYGEQEEEDGMVIGYRISLPCTELIKDTLAKYQLKSEKRGEETILGVFPK